MSSAGAPAGSSAVSSAGSPAGAQQATGPVPSSGPRSGGAARAPRPAPAPGGARRGPDASGDHVWIGLILATAAVETVLTLADHGLLGSPRWRPWALQNGAFWAGLLHGWQPNFAAQPATMFASYAFLHAGWEHLLGNMTALVWLGRMLGGRIGAGRFALIYALSILGGGLGFGLLSTSPSPMVGASGAIMGLVGVWIVWDRRDMAALGDPRATPVALGRTAAVAALNLVMFLLADGLLAWETHLGGFLAGAAAATLIPPRD